MKIGLAQLNSRDDKERNLVAAEAAIDKLTAQGADLIMLPEMVNFLGSDLDNARAAETIPGPSTDRLQAKAREHGVFLHCGSVVESRGGRLYNTSVVFDGSGAEVARYSKIHLFDVALPDGKVYKESAAITPGVEVATFECEGLTAGLAICTTCAFPNYSEPWPIRVHTYCWSLPPSPSPPAKTNGSRCSGPAPSRMVATWQPVDNGGAPRPVTNATVTAWWWIPGE